MEAARNQHIRIKRLRPGQSVEVRLDVGAEIMCCAGRIRVSGVCLAAGERYTIDVAATARITAIEGMRGEWLEDTGVVLVSVPA